MTYLGGGTDEYPLKARELNQSFIGADFGVNHAGATVYGKIGAVKIYQTHVLVSLAGVAEPAIQLDLEQPLYFSRSQHETQVVEYLDEFSKHLTGR